MKLFLKWLVVSTAAKVIILTACLLTGAIMYGKFNIDNYLSRSLYLIGMIGLVIVAIVGIVAAFINAKKENK